MGPLTHAAEVSALIVRHIAEAGAGGSRGRRSKVVDLRAATSRQAGAAA
jgi:hypothetical protein